MCHTFHADLSTLYARGRYCTGRRSNTVPNHMRVTYRQGSVTSLTASLVPATTTVGSMHGGHSLIIHMPPRPTRSANFHGTLTLATLVPCSPPLPCPCRHVSVRPSVPAAASWTVYGTSGSSRRAPCGRDARVSRVTWHGGTAGAARLATGTGWLLTQRGCQPTGVFGLAFRARVARVAVWSCSGCALVARVARMAEGCYAQVALALCTPAQRELTRGNPQHNHFCEVAMFVL